LTRGISEMFENVPDFTFAEKDPATIRAEIIHGYEAAYLADTGQSITLAAGNKRRLYLLAQAEREIQLRALIDATGKNYFLKYAQGDLLDLYGSNYGERGARLQESFATTTIQFTLEVATTSGSIVPAGTKVAAANGITFTTTASAIIPPGELTGDAPAISDVAGTSTNNLLPGQINQLVQWDNSFVIRASNITESDGGVDKEADEPYRFRLWLLPDSFSVAGPVNSYIFFARSASQEIIDLSVYSREELLGSDYAGQVGIVVLCKNGTLPTPEIIQKVQAACDHKRRRPIAIQVIVESPQVVSYDIKLTYYISSKDASSVASIQKAVERAVADYALWQRSKIGRDINDDELLARVKSAGAKRMTLVSPHFQALNAQQVGIANKISVTFGALEDE